MEQTSPSRARTLAVALVLTAVAGMAHAQMTPPAFMFAVNSPLDPTKTFTVYRSEKVTFKNPPGTWFSPTSVAQNIAPCDGVISTVHNFVITGIDASVSSFQPGPAELMGVSIVENRGGAKIRRFKSFGHQVSFHDPIGIRMLGSATIELLYGWRGAGGLDAAGNVIPSTAELVVVINGYCADEVLNPPQNN